jgi:hypothetical protein
MRTTLDLPDELFREAKARAALEGVKLKDLMERFVRQGLQTCNRGADSGPLIRSDIPIPERWRVNAPRVRIMTNAEMQELFDEDDFGDLIGMAK